MLKFQPKQLLTLADHLETQGATFDARADEHIKASEKEDAEKLRKRAEGRRHYAAVCREAVRLLTARTKRGAFTAPTLDEVRAYAAQAHPLWPSADILAWWNHFESQGWKVSGKTPMLNWQRAADNGFGRWKEKNPERARASYSAPAGQRAKGDPEGWADFLKSLSRKYKEYRFEAEWVRSDFLKAQRAAK